MWSGVTANAQAIHGWYQTGSTTAKYVGSEYHTGTTTTEKQSYIYNSDWDDYQGFS